MQLSLRAKISFGMITISLCLLIVGVVCLRILSLTSDLQKITAQNAALAEMRYLGSEAARLFLRVTTPGLSSSEMDRLQKKFEAHVDMYEQVYKDGYKNLPRTADEIEIDELQKKAWHVFLDQARLTISKIRSPEEENFVKDQATTHVPKLKVAHNDAFDVLTDHRKKSLESWQARNDTFVRWGSVICLSVILLGFLLCAVIGYWLARRLPMLLSKITDDLAAASTAVQSTAGDLTASSQAMAERSSMQSADLQRTASAIVEVTAMVERTAENANHVSDSASTSKRSAEKGRQVVREVEDAIKAISEASQNVFNQSNETNREINHVAQLIGDITQKTKIIDDIVFQTRLLSFNASVEAARAGEAGKGFAVVAEEVAKLSHLSGDASKEIAALLKQRMQEVGDIVSRNKKQVDQLLTANRSVLETGIEKVNACSTVFNDIARDVANVDQLLDEIKTASREQASGVNDIKQSVINLEQQTHQNTEESQRTAQAAENLQTQADKFAEGIKQTNALFRIRAAG